MSKAVIFVLVAGCSLCFGSNLPVQHESLNPDNRPTENSRLIRFVALEFPLPAGLKHELWLEPETIRSLRAQKVTFIDVTDTHDLEYFARRNLFRRPTFPTEVTHEKVVQNMISLIDMKNYENNLEKLTEFKTRDAKSESGEKAAEWVAEQAMKVSIKVAEVDMIKNRQFDQVNVRAVILGTDKDAPIVILGAHLDSTAGYFQSRSPGADDDGSGTIMVLELLRAVSKAFLAGTFQPRQTIEFHWYAGEELGLVGSGNVAKEYAKENRNVFAMMQFDMVGYKSKSGNVGVVTDHTNPELTDFMRLLIDSYLSIGRTDKPCGYGCSDHSSWDRAGFASCFPFEAPYGSENPDIHSAKDVIGNLDFKHAFEFGKLGIGYLVEL